MTGQEKTRWKNWVDSLRQQMMRNQQESLGLAPVPRFQAEELINASLMELASRLAS